ncbi:MAG: mechanosensitive ion channel family protein [Candidatus Pacebacteria bacterium]|nr:mechanosensitive ion channel family protein [Candidatus Paceibacterota bacterium]
MGRLAEWIQANTGLLPLTQYKIVASIAVLILLWLIRTVVLNVVFRRTQDVRVRYRWKKVSLYVAGTLGFLFLGGLWLRAFQSVGTFLGLVSAGLTIALKDLVSDVAGWIFILWRRPMEVGDRIQIGEHRGDVIDIRVFQFTLMEIGNWVDADQSTGRVIHIPNGMVLSEMLANYSKGFQFIWNEIAVLVTFESNWREAKAILQDIASKHAEQLSSEAEQKIREAARRFLIFYLNP